MKLMICDVTGGGQLEFVVVLDKGEQNISRCAQDVIFERPLELDDTRSLLQLKWTNLSPRT